MDHPNQGESREPTTRCPPLADTRSATLAYPGNLIAALRETLTHPPVTGES